MLGKKEAYFVISVNAFPIRILEDFSQEFNDHLFLLAYWLRIPAEKNQITTGFLDYSLQDSD